jgi:hypothetical protein
VAHGFVVGRARVKLGVGVDAAHFLLGAQLGDRGIDWLYANVGYLHALVVVNLKSFIDDFRWSLNSQALVGTLAGATAEHGLLLHANGLIVFCIFVHSETDQILVCLSVVDRVAWALLVELDGRH